jgi:hypothetical protein
VFSEAIRRHEGGALFGGAAWEGRDYGNLEEPGGLREWKGGGAGWILPNPAEDMDEKGDDATARGCAREVSGAGFCVPCSRQADLSGHREPFQDGRRGSAGSVPRGGALAWSRKRLGARDMVIRARMTAQAGFGKDTKDG